MDMASVKVRHLPREFPSMVQATLASAPPPAGSSRFDELAALYRLTDRLYRAQTMAQVYEAALDAISDALGCERASILLFDEEGVMRFVAWRGLSEGYRAAVEGHSPWKPGDCNAEPIFVEDIARAAEPDWIKRTISDEGITALAFIPLVAQGGVIGKFMTYYGEPHGFTPHHTELAVTIARQVGFSIERTRAERARRDAEAALRASEERSRLMLENAPVMIWVSNQDGHCAHLNRMLREFWGVGEEEIGRFDWSPTVHPDDAAQITRTMQAALATASPVQVKARYRNKDGQYRVLVTDAQPRFSERGAFLGMIGVNVDVTEREEAERALRESEERFRQAVEAAPSGMLVIDSAGLVTLVNAQAERLFGFDRGALVGQPLENLIRDNGGEHPIRDWLAGAGIRSCPLPMGAGQTARAIRRDGCELPVEIGLNAMETAQGRFTLVAIVDISERLRAQAQREVLLAELNHRVKNTLAVVQGIALQTFKGLDAAKDARLAFEGRLVALAGAHNMLTRTSWSHAALGEIVEEALGAKLASRDRIAVSGPLVLLPPKAALAVALALHELLTNAVKSGALSEEKGRITIDWSVQSDPARFAITWTEQGGPPVTAPPRRGFGSRLIEQILADDLAGEVSLSFPSDGVVCRIEAPLEPPA
jgi:PAS domain S-box-containing protein